MKKIFISIIAFTLLLSFGYTNASAKAIGIKGGYLMPQDDLSNVADDTTTFGIYFDMGTFLINNLDFRPGLDYATLEKDDFKYAKVYGIHFDWYWHFMDKGAIAPFLGFGPALNYYTGGQFKNDNKDSDAGVDLFLGFDIKIGGTPLSLMIEGRYKFFDIADRDVTAGSLNIGIAYNF
jgi:hypothetical protein